ncbi:MAG: class I SAM-dependent methyltransferase [Deltaproteobacteria bacterium]|nr:class I SAM-dependent methyltransferase [Deltaproteobacteria bacterium]
MTEHRVATHLGVDPAAYDAQIGRWVPGYEDMIATVVSILGDVLPADPLVIDLGAGTGALAGAILAGIPRARLVLIDIDPTMLEGAATRLARFGPRSELRRASFDDALPPCDAVVASLALHHVAELDRKRALYGRIYTALRPGGVLLSADATVHEDGPEHARFYREWAARMATAGIPAEEARGLFAQWALEDRYLPLATELTLLAEAGFPRPECFWKQGAPTVFGGFRAPAA